MPVAIYIPRGWQLAIHAIDFVIIIAYLTGVVALGLWLGRGQKGAADYFLGGRNLPWWALLGSIVATETSTATFLSVPGIAYEPGGDLRFLQLGIGFVVGRLLIVVILLPQYFRGQLYTAYEVLNQRFGGAVKTVASLLFLVARNLGDGLRLFLTAIALEKSMGLSLSTCVVIVGAATIVYCVAGGMRSVVWNDCLQFIVYMVGGAVALGFVLRLLPGGWEQFRSFADAEDKLRLFDFSAGFDDPFTFAAGLFGGAVLTLGTHGTDQMMVQRLLCARSFADAAKALVGSGLVVLGQFALFLLLGAALACYYQHFPPASSFESPDRVFATFIVERLPIGVVGVLLAAVFAAAMSTLSSSLNSSAASAVNDLYLPLVDKPSQRHVLWVSRLATVAFGLVQIAVGIAAQYISENVVSDALAIAGFAVGILLGVFFLGVLTRIVGQTAALAGMLAGLAVAAYVKFGTDIAWPWLPVFGSVATFAVGLTAELALRICGLRRV